MNKNISRFIAAAWGLQVLLGCTPDDESFRDNRVMDLSRVDSVALVASHYMVLADGHAQLELYPRLFIREGNQIPDERVNAEWLEYVSESGIPLDRYFTTSDAALIGQTVTARLKIKGHRRQSEKFGKGSAGRNFVI